LSSKKIFNHPSLIFANELKEICAPLKALNIAYFSHGRVDAKGTFTAISSEPDFFKLYLEKKYYNFDIHMANQRMPEQYILWDTFQGDKESRNLEEDFISFNLDHTFTIIQEHKGIKDCFHFAAKRENVWINQCYLQNLDLLKKFISYFNEISFQLDDAKSGFFINTLLTETASTEFNSKIQSDRIYFDKDHYLTKRELGCLHWLSQGKTLEEIAIILNITLRTVKAHINNIKEKFSISNQFQLGMLYQELNKLNFSIK
jgi:DNA-binding CsgD family transcriptional regulator